MQIDDRIKLKWCPDCQEEIEVTDGQNTCPHCGGTLEEVPGEENELLTEEQEGVEDDLDKDLEEEELEEILEE